MSFYLQNEATTTRDMADFIAYWNGVNVFEASSQFDSTQFTFTVVAGGSGTLAFAGYEPPARYDLDDVVVTQATTPEPASLWLVGVAALGSYWLKRCQVD